MSYIICLIIKESLIPIIVKLLFVYSIIIMIKAKF